MRTIIVRAEKEERKLIEVSLKAQNVSITDTNAEGDIHLEMDISSKYLTEIVRFQLDLIEEANVYVSFKMKNQNFVYRFNQIRYSANVT